MCATTPDSFGAVCMIGKHSASRATSPLRLPSAASPALPAPLIHSRALRYSLLLSPESISLSTQTLLYLQWWLPHRPAGWPGRSQTCICVPVLCALPREPIPCDRTGVRAAVLLEAHTAGSSKLSGTNQGQSHWARRHGRLAGAWWMGQG